MSKNKGYQGYKNYQTWNVILWIGNDEGLYNLARDVKSYQAFKDSLRELGGAIALETPDNVAWNDSGLDLKAIDAYFKEIRE